MINIYRFLGVTFLAAYLSLLQVNGQQLCAPLGVLNLTISHEAVVSWDANPEETCDISHYLIYITDDEGEERIFVVSSTFLDVKFLPVCEDYIFKVVAITMENAEGEIVSLARKIPLPADANLTVGMVKVSQDEGQWVHLDWTMDDEWIKCADRFWVIINDEVIHHIQDIFTFNTSVIIPNLAPCTNYEFGVMAIYNWEIEGPITVITHTTSAGVPQSPRLHYILIERTSATMTWSVEGYATNKCPILKADLNVINNYDLSLDIVDQSTRPPILVQLPNLLPDSIYLVNVTLVNKAGPSQPVLLVIQTKV